MKITCTHCNTNYQVNIDKLKPEGIEYKCAKCLKYFLITESDLSHPKSETSINMSTQTTRYSDDDNLNTLVTSVVDDLKGYGDRLNSQISKLSDIGRALSGVTNIPILLEMIVDQAREFTNADAGTLYLKEENASLKISYKANYNLI